MVHIYQDPVPVSHPASNKRRPYLQPSAIPLQPLRNPPGHPDIVLNAPTPLPQQRSPLKSTHVVSSPKPNYHHLNYVPIPPPPANAHIYTDSPIKRAAPVPPRPPFRPGPPVMQQPLFTTFNSNLDTFEQENFQPAPVVPDHFADFPAPSCGHKQPLKRSLSDAVAPSDRPFKKVRQEEGPQLPEPEDMPPIDDDGNKPSYSYAQMIGMAILRAPHRRLTLAQIYEWISNTFAFYREDTKQGWHNSIRHNLSLNKAFKKVERPKGDAGKGSYWVIEPGMESTFIKDKSRKGNSMSHMTVHSNIMRPEGPHLPQALSEALAPSPFIVQSNAPPRPDTAPALADLSSDATLPASDPALNEQDVPDVEDHALPRAPQSSPPGAINSSPPVAAVHHRRAGSSPTARVQRPPSHRPTRTLATMDDSGYFSSIESSVLRPNKTTVILTSELDVEPLRTKRGRAEEEIARIRSSSHDITPSRARFRNAGPEGAVQSSSPTRLSPATRLNPVTPHPVFKKPARPPPSISPNTQLHLHRRAMQEWTNSPIKSVGLANADLDPYSPFKWSVASYGVPEESFEIFSDPVTGLTPATPAGGFSSPLKASAKRPALGRASTTANVLSEAPDHGHRHHAKSPTKGPLPKPAPRATLSGSPLKRCMSNVSILDDPDDLFDFNSFGNDNSDNDDDGVDILKGFEKIGGSAPQASSGHIRRAGRRPSLSARSFTSLF